MGETEKIQIMSKEKFNKHLRRLGFNLVPGEKPIQRIGRDIQIESILDEIDFEKIHNVMVFLDWKWYDMSQLNQLTEYVPTPEELETKSRRLLSSLWDIPLTGENPQYNITGGGGLEATRWVWDGIKSLSLRFVLEQWEHDYESVQLELDQYCSEDELVRIQNRINLQNNVENI